MLFQFRDKFEVQFRLKMGATSHNKHQLAAMGGVTFGDSFLAVALRKESP